MHGPSSTTVAAAAAAFAFSWPVAAPIPERAPPTPAPLPPPSPAKFSCWPMAATPASPTSTSTPTVSTHEMRHRAHGAQNIRARPRTTGTIRKSPVRIAKKSTAASHQR